MHKYLSLTRVLFKNTAGMISDGKTKKSRVYLLYIVIAICLLPSFFLLYKMFDFAMGQLVILDQGGTMLAIGFHLCSFVTFFFSLFMIPGVFYFSKDSETLLALPLKPQTILSAKFSVCLVYEYVFTLAVLIPLYLAYLNHSDVLILFYVFSILILLTIPIFPLVLTSVITMLVMRFMPFFKNRDRFNLIAGIVGVTLAMGLSLFLNTSTFSEDPNALIMMLIDGNNSLINILSAMFPGIPFASRALISGDMLQLCIYIIINLVAIMVFVFFGRLFYFKGAIGLNETGSTRKRFSQQDMSKLAHRRNVVYSSMQKELRLIVRTPVYFLNCIAIVFMMPIILIATFMFGENSLAQLSDQLLNFDIASTLPYAIFIGLIAGMVFANMSFISSTCISREGSNVMFMKYIPMSYGKQIQAKINCGILVSGFGILIIMAAAILLLKGIPFILFVAGFIASMVTNILGNYLGAMIDILHPKLVWEHEAAAVKQNLSAMVAFFGGFLFAVGLGAIMIYLPVDSIWMSVSITSLVSILLCVVFYKCLPSIANKLMSKL